MPLKAFKFALYSPPSCYSTVPSVIYVYDGTFLSRNSVAHHQGGGSFHIFDGAFVAGGSLVFLKHTVGT